MKMLYDDFLGWVLVNHQGEIVLVLGEEVKGMKQQILGYAVTVGAQDLVVFVLGGLFASRLYGVAKRLYNHAEGVVGHLAGAGTKK